MHTMTKGRLMSFRSLRIALVSCVVAALSFGIAACGSSNKSSTSTSASKFPVVEGKKGGSVTSLASGDVDFMDPGQTYYQFALQIVSSTQRSLYYYDPSKNDEQVPDIADGKPEFSADNKKLTIHLKKGIKYAPPVNREVKAADIKYAFERAFSANVPNAYVSLYFTSIKGAPTKATKTVQDIPGIQTPDDYTLVFELTQPNALLVYAAMVMPVTVPVPKEYAAKFDAQSPTTYNENVAQSGPYMIPADAKGHLTGWKPGKSIKAVRNPNWDGSTDFRPAYLDSWAVQEGNNDTAVSGRRILQGRDLIQGDGQPPAAIIKQALSRYKSQLRLVSGGGVRYIALNTRHKPFDNVNVRKAVVAGFDRTALRLQRGGATVGPIAWAYLPPDFPGYKESGGKTPPANLDFLKSETGDPALAASYMKKAGYPSGKYTGSEKLLTIATDADPGKAVSENAQQQFQKLGFKLNFRVVPQDTLYTKFCGVPKTDYAICPNVGFFKDFNDAQVMLDSTFSGNAIIPSGNTNWPLLNDPKINALIEKARPLKPGPERDQAWADVNVAVASLAPAIPYLWDLTPVVWSKNVNMAIDSSASGAFMAFVSLK